MTDVPLHEWRVLQQATNERAWRTGKHASHTQQPAQQRRIFSRITAHMAQSRLLMLILYFLLPESNQNQTRTMTPHLPDPGGGGGGIPRRLPGHGDCSAKRASLA